MGANFILWGMFDCTNGAQELEKSKERETEMWAQLQQVRTSALMSNTKLVSQKDLTSTPRRLNCLTLCKALPRKANG